MIEAAAEILHAGGLVAFPTETVYGLAADALNETAVKKVFGAKGRPSDNPLIVHVSNSDQLFDLVDEMPEKGEVLAKKFWPGPLTLIVKRTFLVPDIVTANLDTVAVRMPKHPVALALIGKLDRGIVGPSANLSGRPSPTTAAHVIADLAGRIDLVLDAGPTEIGVESTVVDVTIDPPVILRFGGLPKEKIEDTIGPTQVSEVEELLRRSPGTRHRHYAPRAKIILVEEGNRHEFARLLKLHRQQGKKVAGIVHSSSLVNLERGEFFRALPSSVDFFARMLFRLLREMDELGVELLLIESVKEEGLGAAIMDRLRRAASN